MKRRDFIALSTAPITSAAGFLMEPTASPGNEDTPAGPLDAEIIASATTLKIEIFRGTKNLIGEFQIGGSFGIDKEHDEDNSSEPDEALSLPLIHKLLAAFTSKPANG